MRFPATVRAGRGPCDRLPNAYGRTMLDIALIAAGIAFFGLAAGYATLCERL